MCLCVYVLFLFRLEPYVQYKYSLQLTTFCTSAGVGLLTCAAEEEKQRPPVQPWQDAGLDDRASSALCC